jgi:dethiobiotin synthetase
VRRYVILGTGTGVGKTFVTASLARELGRRGVAVEALKPIETGIVGGDGRGAPPAGSDAHLLEQASFHVKPRRPHPRFAFTPSVSPHLASDEQGCIIESGEIVIWLHMASHHTTLLQFVETAGGVFSPISVSETNFNLARALEPAALILVAPDALGVLHDVRATVEAMQARGRAPDALVLTEARATDASTGTNATELGRLGLPAPTCVLRRNSPEDVRPLADWVSARAITPRGPDDLDRDEWTARRGVRRDRCRG